MTWSHVEKIISKGSVPKSHPGCALRPAQCARCGLLHADWPPRSPSSYVPVRVDIQVDVDDEEIANIDHPQIDRTNLLHLIAGRIEVAGPLRLLAQAAAGSPGLHADVDGLAVGSSQRTSRLLSGLDTSLAAIRYAIQGRPPEMPRVNARRFILRLLMAAAPGRWTRQAGAT